jgi:aldehyde:ferredoxin oxidoreductase
MDLIDQGTITSENLDGIDLKWANMDAVFQLLDKIAHHDGIGVLLGEGSMAVGKEFGVDPEQIAAIHNVEPTYHDMRAINGMALAYGISPHYGGSHNSCDYYMNTQGIAFEEIDIQSTDAKDCNPEVAQMAARLMAYRAFYSSIIMCLFANPPASTTAKYLELITGMEVDLDKVKEWGERILNLKRLFNLKMGHVPSDEHIPKILLTALPESGQEGNVPDTEMLYREFYKFLDWDPDTGRPSIEKLNQLGLTDFASF